MNERIRELAEQCHHRYSEYNIDFEKFAELIVRECATLAFDGPNGILEHFGVEQDER